MTHRRDFIKQLVIAGTLGSLPYDRLFSQQKSFVQKPTRDMIWANLLHLSYNMWEDNQPEKYKDDDYNCSSCQEAREWAHGYRSSLTFDEGVWNTLLNAMAAVGMNMIVIDLGDAVVYESHPELAVKNAWTPAKLKSELKKIRELGLEPIPKLNFATTHDVWLGEYSRMVSTPKYYDVCRNLIREVIDLFDTPRFFHLGMDEEVASYQRKFDYVVLRQNDLWWKDLYFLANEVEKKNVRPWIWSDYAWHQPDVFFKKMPKSILQSNWYYDSSFDVNKLEGARKTYVQLYQNLEKQGFDQVPTGSNHSNDVNMEGTIEHCRHLIDPSRLYGFMTAPWRPTMTQCLERHLEAINQIGRGISSFT